MNTGPLRAYAITVSDRRAAGITVDESGPMALDILNSAGYEVINTLVPDGVEPVQTAIRAAIDDQADVVFTMGGTGISPRDLTPEAVSGLIEREIPGLAELVRSTGLKATPMAAISRGVAGTIGSTLVITLPGSPKAVAESLEPLLPIIPHALGQMSGDDHR